MKLGIAFLLSLSTLTHANCDQLFDNFASNLDLGSWKVPSKGVNIDSKETGYKRLSKSNKKGRKDPGPTLTIHKKKDGMKFKVLRNKDLKTKESDHDIVYTNFNCTEFNFFTKRYANLQFDLNQGSCNDLKRDYSLENIKLYNLIGLCMEYFPKTNSIQEKLKESSLKVIKQ